MNTRLQVEHAITEATLGLDLVAHQIEIAGGAPLPPEWLAGGPRPRGHAIELRLYAEDPVDYLPCAGRILAWEEPAGPGVRVDAGVEQGSDVGLDFDPLLAKIIVSAASRGAAIARGRRALSELVVLGVRTNAPLLDAVLALPEFASGDYTTGLLAEVPPISAKPVPDAAWIAAAMDLGSLPRASAAASPVGDPWDQPSGWRPGA